MITLSRTQAITVPAYDAPAESLGLLHDQVVADRIVCSVNRDTGRSTAADLDQVPHTIAADLHASRQDRNKGVIAGVNPDRGKIRGMIVSENTIHDVVNNVDTAGRVNSGRAVRIRKAAGICHDIAADDAADTRQPDAVPSVLRETIVLDNIAGSRRVGGNIDTVRKTLDRAVANGDQGISLERGYASAARSNSRRQIAQPKAVAVDRDIVRRNLDREDIGRGGDNVLS